MLPPLENTPTVSAYPNGLEPLLRLFRLVPLLVFGQAVPIGRGTLPRDSIVDNLTRGNLFDLASWRIEDE